MFLRTQPIPKKHFIGKRLNMSFAQNKTFELWRSFMPHCKKNQNAIGNDLYSIEVYPEGFYDDFNPNRDFEKWAAMEASGTDNVPDDMEMLVITDGLYAVFLHKGPAVEGQKTYQYIFQEWLPNSEYQLDNRPHFAVMGEKYQQDSSDSEEEIWIPVV